MESQSLLSYLQRSLAMVMNEVTLTQAPTSNSLFAGDNDFAITLLVDSIERVLQHGRKTKFFGDPVLWDVCCEFGRRPWATVLLGTANASGDSDESRGRIFLRYLIQNQLLVVFADELSQNEEILDEYFEPYAIMARTDDYAIFRQQLVSLEALPLSFPGAPGPKVSYTPPPAQTSPVVQPAKQPEPQEVPTQPAAASQQLTPTPNDSHQTPTVAVVSSAPAASVNTTPAPMAVLASKKKKTVNRLISFDSGSNDSTTRKIKKSAVVSSSSVVDNEPAQPELRASQETANSLLDSSLEIAANDTQAILVDSSNASPDPVIQPQPERTPEPTVAQPINNDDTTPIASAPTESEPTLTSTSEAPFRDAADVETPINPPPDPKAEDLSKTTQSESTPSSPSTDQTHSDQPAATAAAIVYEETQATQKSNEIAVDNDSDEEDEGKTLKLEVNHDDDHDSLDSASEDEGDADVQNDTINSTVDTTTEQGDQSDEEVLTSIESADLSKLLAGFAASFSENQ